MFISMLELTCTLPMLQTTASLSSSSSSLGREFKFSFPNRSIAFSNGKKEPTISLASTLTVRPLRCPKKGSHCALNEVSVDTALLVNKKDSVVLAVQSNTVVRACTRDTGTVCPLIHNPASISPHLYTKDHQQHEGCVRGCHNPSHFCF